MSRRIAVLLAALLPFAAVRAQGPADAARAPETLPVTRVVLYKGGVGYFEHVGRVAGDAQLVVQFTGAQLDDVLKSLTVVDLGDGRVTGVTYDSPTPVERRLQALRLRVGEDAAVFDVLKAMRGARLEVQTGTGSVASGRLLGVERRTRDRQENGGTIETDEVTLVTDAGEIATLALGRNARVKIADADLRQELGRYLTIAGSSRDRDARRMVITTSGAGSRRFLVSYVTEAAVWKTTYRLVFPSSGTGGPRLQGWALVDNGSAEDWENVELALVAGAPQVFVQTLSQPLYTRRPVVPLPDGLTPTPQLHSPTLTSSAGSLAGTVRDTSGSPLPGVSVSFRNAGGRQVATAFTDDSGRYVLSNLPDGPGTLVAQLAGFNTRSERVTIGGGAAAERNLALEVGSLSESVSVAAAPPPPAPAMSGAIEESYASPTEVEDRMANQPPAASGAALGEMFEYRLTDRVTIRRNQSALVPIVQAAVRADRVSLWTASMGERPRRAIWLTNSSALTLDGGSLSVVDAGAFAGEGLLDSMKPGERRLVSYGVDLGVLVRVDLGTGASRTVRVRIAEGRLTREVQEEDRRTYTVRNADTDPRVVVIEHPARPGWEVSADVKPAETSATAHRFELTVAPGATATLAVAERRPRTVVLQVARLDEPQLTIVTADRPDERAALERTLEPVFAKRAEVLRLERDMSAKDAEANTIRKEQERVRENMKALQRSDSERRLLERYVSQLDAGETRLAELTNQVATLRAARDKADGELSALVARITFDSRQ